MLLSFVKTVFKNNHGIFNYYNFMPVQMFRRKPIQKIDSPKPNTGIRHRLEILNFDSKNEEHDEDAELEDVEDLEGDFSNVAGVYDEYESEMLQKRQQIAFETTRKKCFKIEKQPNLLTWGEKEQIRYLHKESPDEWPVERLAECFPATADIIKKILKAKWKPKDLQELERHDERVKHNWKLLKDGKLKFDPYLQAHVSKFTERRHVLPRPDTANLFNSMKTRIRKPGQKDEFANIIQSYNDILKKSNKEHSEKGEKGHEIKTEERELKSEVLEEMPNELSPPPKGDSYVLDGPSNRNSWKPITWDAYREKYLPDETMPVSSSRTNEIENTSSTHYSPSVNINAENANAKLAKLSNSEEEIEDRILNKIKIPRNKWVKGKTYKYGDCFYDDDGEFLYRVPGLT